jgi:hypothetical protein
MTYLRYQTGYGAVGQGINNGWLRAAAASANP